MLSTIHDFAFFPTKPCWTKLLSGPLEASRAHPVDGASTVHRLSLWLTRFSWILVMSRKNALISLTVFETKNERRVHTRFVRTWNIFRVSGVIVRMPYLLWRKVRWANSIYWMSTTNTELAEFCFVGLGRSKKRGTLGGRITKAWVQMFFLQVWTARYPNSPRKFCNGS